MAGDVWRDRIAGKKIKEIWCQERTAGGAPPDENELIVRAMYLGDGTQLIFDTDEAPYAKLKVVPADAQQSLVECLSCGWRGNEDDLSLRQNPDNGFPPMPGEVCPSCGSLGFEPVSSDPRTVAEILSGNEWMSRDEGNRIADAVDGETSVTVLEWLCDQLECDAPTATEAKLAAIIRGMLLSRDRRADTDAAGLS